MKKYLIIILFLVAFVSPLFVFAQNQTVFPSAGITPESPFYFFDKLGEALQEFFTFNPEGKAHLQITFAAERIAEIKVILETKGVEAKGLDVAQSRLQAHLANAATIITEQKSEGKDVKTLAKELDDDFNEPKFALKEAFKAEKRSLETKEKELKAKIREARQVNDTAQVEVLVKELGEVKAQKELLEIKEDEQEEVLEKEEERFEEEMEDKEEAEKSISEAEKEKQEILNEVAKEGVSIPVESFEKFDRLIAQAKELFGRGNYQGAEQLAEQAEKSLDKIKDAAEDLDKAKKNEEELEKEQAEQAKEGDKEEIESLKKEREKAEEAARKAEEQLRESGKDED